MAGVESGTSRGRERDGVLHTLCPVEVLNLCDTAVFDGVAAGPVLAPLPPRGKARGPYSLRQVNSQLAHILLHPMPFLASGRFTSMVRTRLLRLCPE